MLTLKMSAALLHCSGGVRIYFLYKAPIYLPIEDIKPFGQNGWSVQTWISNLLVKMVKVFRLKALTINFYFNKTFRNSRDGEG